MKKIKTILITALVFLGCIQSSCVNELLDRPVTSELDQSVFWKTPADATSALAGVYNALRPIYYKGGLWDIASEMCNTGSGYATYNVGPLGDRFSAGTYNYWGWLFTIVNRANMVIMNVDLMLEKGPSNTDKALLERVKAEAKMHRALAYFMLVDLWGDLPYITAPIKDNIEAYGLKKTSKYDIIKNGVLADLTEAINVLPSSVSAAEFGRFTKVAAYGFRGKVELYMACWMKNIDNNATEASKYYQMASADFKQVMSVRNTLFRNGTPGSVNGEQKDNTLPNYFYLFSDVGEKDPEIIASVCFKGPNQNFGEAFMLIYYLSNLVPNYRLIDRYQLTTTGGYAPKLTMATDKNNAAGNKSLPNGYFNPAAYENRDWRMNASIIWQGQKQMEVDATGLLTGRYQMFDYLNVSATETLMANTDLLTTFRFRKWSRFQTITGAAREDGPFDYYLMRLPDVWLMYAEAQNELNNGSTAETVELVDRIRARGALPKLANSGISYTSKADFFKVIEQERIIELAGEGHRFFDIRRWRMAESIWNTGGGYQALISPISQRIRPEFENATKIDYDRYYIFKIPQTDVDKNPGLTQNEPWK